MDRKMTSLQDLLSNLNLIKKKGNPGTHTNYPHPTNFLKDPLHIVKATGDYGKSGRSLWRICMEIMANLAGSYGEPARELWRIQPVIMAILAGHYGKSARRLGQIRREIIVNPAEGYGASAGRLS